MNLHVGFVGTRFAGLDGVSLESNKWAEVLSQMGHDIFWFGGDVDKNPEASFIVEEAFFKNKEIPIIKVFY